MSNIAFCGTTDLAGRCLKWICEERPDIKVKVVLTPTDIDSLWWKDHEHIPCDIAKAYGIPVFSSQYALLDFDLDIGFSVLYGEIFKQEVIQSFKKYLINLHTAPLPKYRGCNPFSHALINGETRYGTTLHIIDPGIDTGDIITIWNQDVDPTWTVKDLYKACMKNAFQQFTFNFDRMISGVFQRTKQSEIDPREYPYYKRKDLDLFRDVSRIAKEALKEKTFSDYSQMLFDNIRGLEFPPFEPAYIKLNNGSKIYLTTKKPW